MAQKGARASSPASVSRRILLVDDEPHVRKTIAGLVRSAGHAVVEAEGSMAALSRLAKHPVDLVLTDLGMPDMNGIELAQTIKLQSPTLPVVILTGWGNRGVRQELMRGTLDAVLGKPVGREELLECVEVYARRSASPGTT
jgi:CheY-like chemotaxis protein